MADDPIDKRYRGKKKKSSLLTWKKKFNIRKRFSNKLPLHRRQIRSLMSGWSINEIKSVLMQYEITSMLRELSLLSDSSRPSASTLGQDLLTMYQSSSCCDMVITCCEMTENQCMLMHDSLASHNQFKVHRMLVASRWPYLNEVINEKIANSGNLSFRENHQPGNIASEEMLYTSRYDLDHTNWNIHINGLSEDKLTSLLSEVYNENVKTNQYSSPRKLLPLPTTDDSLHIRNSRRNKQHFRHTTFECDPPAVSRRRSGASRKHKHRFSMDERILSKQHFPPSKVHRVSPSKSNDFSLNSGLSCMDEFRHLSFENHYLKRQGKTVILNSLHDDLLKMYHYTRSGLGDLMLIIKADTPQWTNQNSSVKDKIIYCHRHVLAARSPYFKRLLENQSIPSATQDSSAFVQTLEIDGNIIPPKWMSTVLYTMYTDKIHFLDLSERTVQDMAINNPLFNIEDAITLHQIGNFIEFPMLTCGCEELIVNHLDERNFYCVLQWSSLPHGSDWVRRQVNIFIRDRFTELLGTEVLFKLNASQMVEVLQSDFVNASELDILRCALKWGEQELCRRIELTEPNLLTHTAHSISRNKTDSARRREVLYSRIDELHECTAPVLACVRTQHLLPPNHEIFANAVKRGVISRPPTDLIESVTDKENGSRQWVKSRADFVPPRLFQPYMDETKNILDDTYAQESDCVNLRSMHSLSQDATWGSIRHHSELSSHGVPDTLYMVGQSKVPTRRRYGNRDLHLNFMQQRVEAQKQKTELSKFMGNYYPVPNISVVRDLIGRERELRSSRLVNRILASCADCCHSNSSGFTVVSYAGRLSIPQADVNNQSHEDLDEMKHCNRCSALRLVRLHVVREHGLPDCAVDLLQHPETYYTLSELRGVTVTDTTCADFNFDEAISGAAKCDERQANVAHLPRKPSIINTKYGDNQNTSFVENSDPYWYEKDTTSSIDSNSPYIFVNHTPSRQCDSSSSSDEDKMILQRRRKSTRKGSSSTTSHQSIPDVAASANSSLQRLRDSSRNSISQIQNAAFVTSPSNQFLGQRSSSMNYYDTVICKSSQSSCDEEIRTESKMPFTVGHATNVNFETGAESLISNISRKQHQSANANFTKSRSPRRPVSTDMSELFSKTLDFTDDQSDSGDDNFVHLLSPTNQVIYQRCAESLVHDIPEIVRDGTPPSARAVSKRSPHREKPDIYPSGELQDDLTMECGRYFLHSKDTLPKSDHFDVDGCKSTHYLHASMSDSKLSRHETENDSLDNDTIFL